MSRRCALLGSSRSAAASILASATAAPALDGGTGLVLLDILLDLAQHHLNLVRQHGLSTGSLLAHLLCRLLAVGVVGLASLLGIGSCTLSTL